MASKEAYDEVIVEVVRNYIPNFLQSIESNARIKLKQASGKGQDSFEIQMDSSEQHVARILLEFESYLRYQDMRRVKFKAPPVDKIQEWVEAKGVNNFNFKGNREGKTNQQIANRIAWGISKGIKTQRRNPWYNRRKMANVSELYYKAMAAIGDQYMKDQGLALSEAELNNL